MKEHQLRKEESQNLAEKDEERISAVRKRSAEVFCCGSDCVLCKLPSSLLVYTTWPLCFCTKCKHSLLQCGPFEGPTSHYHTVRAPGHMTSLWGPLVTWSQSEDLRSDDHRLRTPDHKITVWGPLITWPQCEGPRSHDFIVRAPGHMTTVWGPQIIWPWFEGLRSHDHNLRTPDHMTTIWGPHITWPQSGAPDHVILLWGPQITWPQSEGPTSCDQTLRHSWQV